MNNNVNTNWKFAGAGFDVSAMDDIEVLTSGAEKIAMDLAEQYSIHINTSIRKIIKQIPSTTELTFNFVTPSNIWDRSDIIRWTCYMLSAKLSNIQMILSLKAEGKVYFKNAVISIAIKWERKND